MKKLLNLMLLSVLLLMAACGQSEEERKAEQAKNEAMINEKVNAIMEKLEGMPKEDTTAVEQPIVDSTQVTEQPEK